jgi:hypothetical protein
MSTSFSGLSGPSVRSQPPVLTGFACPDQIW